MLNLTNDRAFMRFSLRLSVLFVFLLATPAACSSKLGESAATAAAISPAAASLFSSIGARLKANPNFQSQLAIKQQSTFTSLFGAAKLSSQTAVGLSSLDARYGTPGQFLQAMGVSATTLSVDEVQKAVTLPTAVGSSVSQLDILADQSRDWYQRWQHQILMPSFGAAKILRPT
jgi:hypothetical protein